MGAVPGRVLRPGNLFGAITLYNVLQNTLLTERGYVAGNIAFTTGALLWARRSGTGWGEMGLDREGVGRGLATGVATSAAAAGLAYAVRETDLTRSLLADDRIQDLGRDEVWRRVLVRFPLGTALFEEVVFRGVLPAAFRHRPVWQRDLIAAAAFAAWHIIPTSRTLAANARGRSLRPGRKVAAVIGGSAAAGMAGLALAGLRRSSSSLAAPWLTHATLNALALLMSARPDRSPIGFDRSHGPRRSRSQGGITEIETQRPR